MTERCSILSTSMFIAQYSTYRQFLTATRSEKIIQIFPFHRKCYSTETTISYFKKTRMEHHGPAGNILTLPNIFHSQPPSHPLTRPLL